MNPMRVPGLPPPETPLERVQRQRRDRLVEANETPLEQVQRQRRERLAETNTQRVQRERRERLAETNVQRVQRERRERLEGLASSSSESGGRGLTHVPKPVMPYNDISNDHLFNKSPHQ